MVLNKAIVHNPLYTLIYQERRLWMKNVYHTCMSIGSPLVSVRQSTWCLGYIATVVIVQERSDVI